MSPKEGTALAFARSLRRLSGGGRGVWSRKPGYARRVDLARLNERRLRFDDSRNAAAAFFVVVLASQVVALVWIDSSAVAFAGVLVYSAAALLTWPFLDAA